MNFKTILIAIAAAVIFAVDQSRAADDDDLTSPNVVPDIIDMHLHAEPANWTGMVAMTVCPGNGPKIFPPAEHGKYDRPWRESCAKPITGAATDETLLQDSLARLKKYNMVAVASGPLTSVHRWRDAAPDRIIPALQFSPAMDFTPDQLRTAFRQGEFRVLGEITAQYDGIAPDDPRMEPYWSLAEDENIPVAIHIGLGPPGIAYDGAYRARLSDPLALEEVLVHHPKLRL